MLIQDQQKMLIQEHVLLRKSRWPIRSDTAEWLIAKDSCLQVLQTSLKQAMLLAINLRLQGFIS